MKKIFIIMALLFAYILLLAAFEYHQIQKTVFVPPADMIFQGSNPGAQNFSTITSSPLLQPPNNSGAKTDKGVVISATAAKSKNRSETHRASPLQGQGAKAADSRSFPSVEDLPKISDGKKYSGEQAEQMPAEILAKIEPLVRMNRLLRENSNLEPVAFNFYEKCAGQEDLMNAVRARCLTHLRKLAQKRGVPVDLSRYSTRLIRLSEFINL